MKWLTYAAKALTKSGRQSIARELLAGQVTVEAVAGYTAKGVAAALDAGTDALGETRCAQIALGATKGGEFCKHLGEAVDPSGEDGTKVSAAERATLQADCEGALTLLVTQDALDKVVETIIAKIP